MKCHSPTQGKDRQFAVLPTRICYTFASELVADPHHTHQDAQKRWSPSFVVCLAQPNKRDTPNKRENPAPFPQSDWEPHDSTPPCRDLRIDCQPPLGSPGLSIS